MYRHEVSKDWLLVRSRYLNSSSIYNMLPTTETGRKRSQAQIQSAMMKAYAHMNTAYITDEDAVSTGAAARGHILEPYAIEEFNNMTGLKLYHWDDEVLVDKQCVLGWSPDALNVMQKPDHRIRHFMGVESKPFTMAGEVKCYSIEKHIEMFMADKMTRVERWQIACGFIVCPYLETAYLIGFNPDCNQRIFAKKYTRSDLAKEIEEIKETILKWMDWLNTLPDDSYLDNYSSRHREDGDPFSDSIIATAMLEEQSRLNPKLNN